MEEQNNEAREEQKNEAREVLTHRQEEQLKGEWVLKLAEERTKKEKKQEQLVLRSAGLIVLIISIIFLAVNYLGK